MGNKKEIYYQYFEKKIKPVVYDLEVSRCKLIKKTFLSSLIFFIAGCFFAYLFILVLLSGKFNPLFFPVLLFLMYTFIIKGIINFITAGKVYNNTFVEKVLPLFLVPVANFKAWPKNHNTDNILDSHLFHNFDERDDKRSYFGFYNRTNIIISETELTMPVKGDVKPQLFNGTIIQLELEKSINNHVIMFSKNEKKYNNYRQFNPNIDEFNRYLYVFAKNEDCINFINNDFWQVIKKIAAAYSAKSFSLSYKDNVVLIALKQKCPMPFGFLFKSLMSAKTYDEIIERFIVIYDLIDLLNKD